MNGLNDLGRLIISYRWLCEERDRQSRGGSVTNAEHVGAAIDDIFRRIVSFEASEPRVRYHQIEFLTGLLAEGGRSKRDRSALRDAVLAHARSLVPDIASSREGRPVAESGGAAASSD
jgi:hypothetical protein